MSENTDTKTIVIIDDEKSFIEILSFALKIYGYRAISYFSTEAAFKKIR